MRKVILYSVLLILGLVGSQILPGALRGVYETTTHVVKVLTMIGLGFIMIHVGYEFDIDKSNLKEYAWDYFVAATAAAFPWIFCLFYFVFVLTPSDFWSSWDTWKDMSLASRFAAPTSAGVLFSMLVAAGLGATWLFRKARILAIFDDLDTVLLMIPLKIMIVGLKWQLGIVIILMTVMLWLAWRFLHRVRIPITWPWVLGYAILIGLFSEWIYLVSKLIDEVVPIHIEVLLPAFVLGCMIAKSDGGHTGLSESADGAHEDILESPNEKRAATIVSAVFMILVGLSMPALVGVSGSPEEVVVADKIAAEVYVLEAETPPEPVSSETAWPGWGWIGLHVLIVTLISNLGKMFPSFCYRKEAHWKHRVAVSVGMFPRGEVGAGVLIISLSYGIGGPVITVAMFSLALNLLLTGWFIVIVKKLLAAVPARPFLPVT